MRISNLYLTRITNAVHKETRKFDMFNINSSDDDGKKIDFNLQFWGVGLH